MNIFISLREAITFGVLRLRRASKVAVIMALGLEEPRDLATISAIPRQPK